MSRTKRICRTLAVVFFAFSVLTLVLAGLQNAKPWFAAPSEQTAPHAVR